MSCSVDVGKLLELSGATRAMNDAARTVYTQQLAQAQGSTDTATYGAYRTQTSALADLQFIDGLVNFSSNVTAEAKTRIPQPVQNLEPALYQKYTKFQGKLAVVQDAKTSLENLNTIINSPTRPGALVEETLLKLVETIDEFQPLFKAASEAAKVVPGGGMIAGASLDAMAKMFEAMTGPLKAKMLETAKMLADVRNGHSEGAHLLGAFSGIGAAGSPERAACLKEVIAEIDGFTGATTDLGKPEITEESIDTTTLDAVAAFLKMLRDAFDPLVIDLDGDGVELTAINDPSIYFDFENSGVSFKSGWVGADDGIVVRDLLGDGMITSGDEFFGDANIDALSDLATFDSNGDGLIDFRDTVWSEMRVWRDANSNGVTDAGELMTMSEAGVASLSVVPEATTNLVFGGLFADLARDNAMREGLFQSEGNTVFATSSYTRTDGTSGESWAVFLDASPADSTIPLPDGFEYDPTVFELPELRGGGYVHDLSVAMSLDTALRDAVESFADGIKDLTHPESVAQFEEILFRWIGATAGLDLAQTTAETQDDRRALVETYFATEPNYQNHNPHDTNWLLTEDVRIDFGYYGMVDALLLRFASQIAGRDGRAATDQAGWEAAYETPISLAANVLFDATTNSVSMTPSTLMLDLANLTPDNRGEAFDFLDSAMPVLRGMRADFFVKESVRWSVPDDAGAYEAFLWNEMIEPNVQRTALEGPIDDPVVAEYAYYRALAETQYFGTDGNDLFDAAKPKYLNSLSRIGEVSTSGDAQDDGNGRDYTFMFGGLGDDVLVSRPWIGPVDPSGVDQSSAILGMGTQNTTMIRYRQGDGDDTVDMTLASGRHIVYLEDIVSTDASFTVDPAAPGTLILQFAGGGSIRFENVVSGNITDPNFTTLSAAEQSAALRSAFLDLHDSANSSVDHDLEFRFADNESVDWQDGFSQSSDGDDFILGRIFFGGDGFTSTLLQGNPLDIKNELTFAGDILGGGLGDDYINGRQGNDTYIYNRGDGVDVIADRVNYTRGVDDVIYPDINEVHIQGFAVDEAVFTRGNALLEVLDAVTGDTLHWTNAAGQMVLSAEDYTRVQPQDDDLVISFIDGAGAHIPDSAVILSGQYFNQFGKVETAIAAIVFDDARYSMSRFLLPIIDTAAGLGEAQTLLFQNGDATLSGGLGDDLYVRHGGVSGNTVIADAGAVTDHDVLRIEAVDPYDIVFSASGDDVLLSLPGQLGSITLQGQLGADAGMAIDEIHVLFPRGGDNSQGVYDYTDPDLHMYDGQFSNYVTDGPYTYDYNLNAYRFTATDIAARLIPASGTEAALDAALADITGTGADETLTGGAGDQVLSGGGGSDAYVFEVGSGHDIIRENGEDARLSIDRLELRGLLPERGIFASDVTFTRSGDFDLLLTIVATGETLLIENQFAGGDSAIEYITWGDGSVWRPEVIAARSTWHGTAGADTITATEGRDTIDAGTGDDVLEGLGGPDIYVFREGDGNDSILDSGGDNVIDLVGVPAATVRAERLAFTNNVLLHYGTQGDTILLVNQTAADPALHPVASIRTDTSAPLTVEDLLTVNHMIGSPTDDNIVGTTGIDILDGRGGDDTLNGNSGTDGFVLRAGDGNDTIIDFGFDVADNRLLLEGLNQGDVRLFREPGQQDLKVEILATGEIATVFNQFGELNSSSRRWGVAEIVFDDGTTLSHEEIGDIAAITGADPADEVLTGGRGWDTYLWGAGYGNDTVADNGRTSDYDKIVLDGLNPEDVTFMRGGYDAIGPDMRVQINATGETLTIADQMTSTYGFVVIDVVQFADGSQLELASIQYSLDQIGSPGDDEMDDYALQGAYIGMEGDDILRGYWQPNTYVWAPGHGNDTITEAELDYTWVGDEETGYEEVVELPIAAEGDVLELTGVTAAQVSLSRSPTNADDLLVTITTPTGGTEVITVTGQFLGPLNGIEEIRGADFTFTTGDILTAAGGLDRPGSTGADMLVGGIGGDQFTPGEGDDHIITGGGRDLIVIEANSGIDTIDGFRPGPIGTRVSLTTTPFATFEALLAAAAQVGADVVIDLGGGNQLILTGVDLADLTVENFGFTRPDILGTPEADTLVGTYLDDTIRGLDDGDLLLGRGGDDALFGDGGDDELLGGAGHDALYGGTDHDLLDGGAGNDTIFGGGGDDHVLFSAGQDSVDGGAGIDRIQFTGNRADYDILIGPGTGSGTPGVTVTDLATGDRTEAVDVERLSFADEEVAVSNAAPVATPIPAASILPGAVLAPTDGALEMAAHFSDADGDFLMFSALDLPQGLVIDAISGRITGTLTAPAGTYTATIGVTDGFGPAVIQPFEITVAAPATLEAMDDTISTDEDTAISLDVLANDSVTGGFTPTVTSHSAAAHGMVTLGLDGLISYTPDADFFGLDLFTYTVEGGGLSSTANVEVTVSAVNDAPVAVADALTVDEDTDLVLDLTGNDTDAEDDPIMVTFYSQPGHGAVLVENGQLIYRPDANFNGIDGFTYDVTDGQGGTSTANVEVTVSAVNDAPDAVADALTVDEDTDFVLDLTGNDTDAEDDPIMVTSYSQPGHGAVLVENGQLIYRPDANFNGIDGFTYDVTDGQGGTSTASVEVTVSAVNDAPVAPTLVELTTAAGAPLLDVAIGATDVDGDPLSFSALTAPGLGAVFFDAATGSFTYTPDPGVSGDDSFVIGIDDGQGGFAQQEVLITIDPPVSGGPQAQDDTGFRVDTYDALAIDLAELLANDTGTNLEITALGAASDGTVTFSGDGTQIIYTAGPTFEGVATFEYTVSDGTLSDVATVFVDVDQVYGYVAEASGRRVLVADRTEDSLLIGSDRGNTLIGRRGDDRLDGRGGNDRLVGGSGEDWLDGGDGKDRLYGGSGEDWLVGGAGHDRLYGGRDADTLIGGAANDRLFGQSGDDRLVGGTGNDYLNGGHGSDVFVFATGDGFDVIGDFGGGARGRYHRNATDTIELDVDGVDDFDALMSTARQWRSGVEFNFGDGDRLVLAGVRASALDADMFDFI